MTRLIVLCCLFSVLSCSNDNSTPFHQLQGNWLRINGSEDKRTVERWNEYKALDENQTGVLIKGTGETFIDDSLIFLEQLSIVMDKNNRYFYVVDGVNAESTYFEITDWTANSFIAHNDKNEFPKRIEYQFNNDSMIAIVGDSTQTIEFSFIRTD